MVTLEKTNKPQNQQYNDYFEEDFFHWDSQTTQHINSPKMQQVVLRKFMIGRLPKKGWERHQK